MASVWSALESTSRAFGGVLSARRTLVTSRLPRSIPVFICMIVNYSVCRGRRDKMISMGTVKTLLTFEEFEQLPDQPGKRELVRGELIEMPPADYKHNDIADRICDSLKAALREAHARGEAVEIGRVFHEMGYLLPGAGWLQPDVSVTHAG